MRRALNFVMADHIDNVLGLALDFSSVKSQAKKEDALLPILGEAAERPGRVAVHPGSR